MRGFKDFASGLRRRLAFTLVAVGLSSACIGQVPAPRWSYAAAGKPYAGRSIRVLDEITPLQETMRKLIPEFTAQTGIKVDYELLSHGDVIGKGQADLFSGRGYYDAVMLHSAQLGPLLAARVLEPIDPLMADPALTNPGLNIADLVAPADESLAKFEGKRYGFLTWNFNQVYWARNDLLSNPAEAQAFKARYRYPLAPAQTWQQLLDIAEFFTRKKGAILGGQALQADFYGVVLEGIPGGTTFNTVWENLLRNWGGDLFDAGGHPAFDTPANVAALKVWARLWRYAPPGQAEYSLVDIPTVMGTGIAAQTIAWSDFVFGVDKPGGAPFAGKFVYAGIPVNADLPKARSAGAEPSMLALSRASKQKQATFLFMQWIIDADTQSRLLTLGNGGVPIRNSSFQLPVLRQSASASLYAAMKSTMSVGAAKPRLPKYFEINDALSPIIQQVGLGTLSPEAAAKAGQAKLLSICQKCTL